MTKLSSILFLLVCNGVAGELARSPQHRRTAVGDRGSIVPSEAPSAVYVEDVESVSKSDKSKGSKGKGSKTKSSKVDKKMKYLAMYADEASEESDSKSAKSGESTKESKSVKADGSDKSEKSVKSVKTEKSAKAVSPPVSDDSISSKSSTYAITYSPTDTIPTPKDLEQLTEMTAEYLEDFMMEFFEKTALTDLDAFLTVMVRDVFVLGEPVIAEYQSNGLFDPESIFIPVTRELDNLIEDAIAQDAYLELLNDLPKSNPFRGTKTIAFTESDGEGTTGSSDSSSFVKAGVAAAAAGVVVLAAGLALLKRRRPSFDDEDVQSLAPKSRSEDMMSTGETCSMGVEDVSTHFSHWRTSRFKDGGEFHDEPLDN